MNQPLEKLKSRLFQQGTNLTQDKTIVYNLCTIMEMVGGYDALMELPIPAFCEILDYLEYKNKLEQKQARSKR